MNAKISTVGSSNDSGPRTLGSLLYADQTKPRPAESHWVSLLRSIAEANEGAFRELYGRTHRLVFTLIMRIVESREVAEELTLDVFHDVWRRAASYDANGGTVLGWIMNQARSRAIDRLRFESRKKRLDPYPDQDCTSISSGSYESVLHRQQREQLRRALLVLTRDEREAIEIAFFAECTYAEVAARLGQPTGTVKTRIRSGLRKLRDALRDEGGDP